ncbi:hypothetical protein D3C83_157410 [compost metagenome]
MARVLVDLVARLRGDRHSQGPRALPGQRIFDTHLVVDHLRIDAGEALRQLQLRAVAHAGDRRRVREVRALDDERVALEAPA